ncbi:MAG: sulfite exporter TauE/SafE family protein [Clostridia bacterium]|nr:sulfite exporter TauE/SafE family protein [Clostridia bacterium]
MFSKLKQKLLHILSGAAIGIINGFFGGGGGMVCVPVLEKLLKLDGKHAHATALAVIFPISFFSGIIYLISGNLNWSTFGFVTSGFVVGGIIGAYLLKNLNNTIIKIVFAIVVLAAGVKLVL